MIEFLTYVTVRQIVSLAEIFLVSSGSTEGRLRTKLRQAQSYEEWKKTALQLDEVLELDRWKKSPCNAYYDSTSLLKILTSLERSRLKDDAENVQEILEVCLRANFAGIESTRLYSQTHLGTKALIESYVDEVKGGSELNRSIPFLSPR